MKQGKNKKQHPYNNLNTKINVKKKENKNYEKHKRVHNQLRNRDNYNHKEIR